MRIFLDEYAAQFYQTPVLVASDGLPRLELYQDGFMIDTIAAYRFKATALVELLE